MKKEQWILPYMKKNRKLLIIVVLLGGLTVCSAAFLMYTSGYLISKAATRPENVLMIYVPIVAVRTFGILRAVARYVERLTGHHMILNILSDMRVRLYRLLEPQALKLRSRFRTGDMLGILADDIEHLQDMYLKTVFPGISALLLYIIFIAALGCFSWPFAGLVAIYAAVLVFLVPLVSLLVTRAKNIELKRGRSRLYRQLTDAVMGVSDWIFSGRQNDFIRTYEEAEDTWLQIERKRQRFIRWRDFAVQCLTAGLVLMMLIWAGGQSAEGALPHTFIAAFVLVVFPLTEAFFPLSDAAAAIPQYEDSLQRMEGLRPEQEKDHPVPSEKAEAVGLQDVTLRFEDVSFSYEYGQPVLQGVSFTVRQGEKIALLGPSGAGKSTILTMIEGVLAPDAGHVMFNGVAAAALQDDISRVVGVLNQKPHLFDTTILNNIRLGNPEASDEDVYWAARQVKLHDLIESLPDGYHTSVQETGSRFSGGERQRIALARILLQGAPVIVLDEPTVGLDPITERELLVTMFEALEGKTVLWITHHLAGAEAADRILFLENGRIEMEGSHLELLQENQRYQRLYKLDAPAVRL
ncbi:thiol reductant ABC exporter subunit CydC [Bacillus sonorensis]|uniref:ABC transporter ATP-binding protein/permease CydD n=2 Tax=Bacillus sonorensis TaxID=119858 RepID=M5PDD3_9BACI|nr:MULTISPECIES: thiol reductant ABC exporter subunit CydC [Bacillus]TWK83444.1 putative ABC transporter ATP-binding protein [Bacillus paralicheniformis]ASB86824.1 ATP-binding/permease protein CydD [Bacillus sonorensis]EME73682.1 ABC transporter ATP-binding protein/permease CydD [Bacillus sonorensis L12]MCZ0072506.1 thiol reductant ABC exporter subunit CydC [Bacillus sonorensis]MCZ0091127.1 thiol reductant ABC exporter subunit CydC [Bacillus sonorensis]